VDIIFGLKQQIQETKAAVSKLEERRSQLHKLQSRLLPLT